MPRSVHDNLLVSYTVLCEERRIILHTEYREVTPAERTDVRFEGVEAYCFDNDVFGTILFGIEEIGVADLVNRERERIEQGRKWGWPGGWAGSLHEETARLTQQEFRGWDVGSSIGLTGWVLARNMTVAAAP